jgi:hypothetical protein
MKGWGGYFWILFLFWGFIHWLMQRERKVTPRDHFLQSINMSLIEHVGEAVVSAKPFDEVRFL